MLLSSFRVIGILLSLVCIAGSNGQSRPPGNQTFDFGTIGLEEDWQHTFQFTNSSSSALEIRDVNLTPPLVVTQMPARVLPGQRASVTVRMETPSLTMKGDGPAGRMTDTITVVTSSRSHPFLEVPANTNLNERVHAFPDSVDFGTISTSSLKARMQAPEELAVSLMVYQDGGKDFRIAPETDVPFLQISTSQANLKDRFEIRLTLVPEKLRSGTANGFVVIHTNDPEFQRLTIPVQAVIEGSW